MAVTDGGGATPDAPVSSEVGVPALDPVIHAQARLRVMTVLASVPAGDRIAFPRLQDLLEITAGNLSTHLRRLEDAGYVAVSKAHRGRTPVTWVELTDRGRVAFEDYRSALSTLLHGTEGTPCRDRRSRAWRA